MSLSRISFLLALVGAASMTLISSACTSPRNEARPYTLEGQVLAIDHERGEVLIKHGDIQNFMPGMTMPFKVKDHALIASIAPGDLVRATLMVGDEDSWLSTIDKTGTAPLAERAEMPPAAFVTPLAPGDKPPDTALTNQDDAEVSLDDWKGKAVAVTFIYVRCPLPQFCPMLDRRFAELQRTIAADDALKGRVHLLSVSFDPDADTPAQLKAHARKLNADPGVWTFATAPRDVVDRFAAQFGVNVIREPDKTITHNMRTTVIGPDGLVVAVYNGSEWTPEQVAADLRRSLE